MTDEPNGAGQDREEQASDGDTAEERSARDRVGEGIKEGLSVLSAFKDAIDETIQEAKERGDLSADRAREAMKEALEKAQAAGERAKERLDFAPQAEVETVREALDGVKERLGRLEEKVFGASRGGEEGDEEA